MFTRPGSASYNPPGSPSTGPSASIDVGITSLVDLAAVRTTNLVVPAIRVWVNAADGTMQIWRLIASSAATDEGVQRPNDFTSDDPKVWFKGSS